jgi:antitoxin MazE
MIMRTVSKWGNSLALRIPAPLAESAGIVEGSEVEVRVSAGRLIVERVRPRYELKKLVAGITRKNRHTAVDWGKPIGKEIW